MRFLNIVFFTFLTCLSFFSVQAQNSDIYIGDAKLKEFPTYTGELKALNPDGVDTNQLSFFEGDSLIQFHIEKPRKADLISKNKTVLFLVLNHQRYQNRTAWYKKVLQQSMNSGMMKEGDEFAVYSFDCNRPEYNNPKKDILFPIKQGFVNTKNAFLSQINGIRFDKDRLTGGCKNKGDIYGAIYSAIKKLDAYATENLKSIVVLADDFSLVTNIKERTIISLSRKSGIPIYGITYYQNIERKYGIEKVCEESFGQMVLDKGNRIDYMSNRLNGLMNNAIQRASGWVYDFNYDTPFDKDGEKHTIRVKYKTQFPVAVFQYESPKMGLFDWIASHILATVLLFISLLVFSIFIFMFLRKRKRKHLEEEEAHHEEMNVLKSKQEAAAIKTKKQEQELKQLKSKEAAKVQKENLLKAQNEQKAEEKNQLQEMSSRGNLPWFTLEHDGASVSIEMNKPVFTFGRGDDDVNYTINLKTISRQHFRVCFDGKGYSIEDLKSSNGTKLNGETIKKSKINHGDVISIGDLQISFHI